MTQQDFRMSKQVDPLMFLLLYLCKAKTLLCFTVTKVIKLFCKYYTCYWDVVNMKLLIL